MLLSPPPSPEFAAAFRAAAGPDGTLAFAAFMDLALYHPQVGYYRRTRRRVGYGGETDFYTSSTSGAVFGELVAAAAASLLAGRDPGAFALIELGAEPGTAPLGGAPHPFGSAQTVGVGEPLPLVGPCVVFSNELFDAQPFRRCVFRRGAWRELGVAWAGDRLREVELAAPPDLPLPSGASEEYHVDAPQAAARLLDRIAAEPWTGLFIACDYGKTWAELAQDTPAGTARAYHRHRQSNDLLAQPGEQDLTCHVCWDWLENSLVEGGFAAPALEFQEAFFVRHAADWIGKTVSAQAAQFSPKKLALMQLLHPAHLGQKFQVLHAWRD